MAFDSLKIFRPLLEEISYLEIPNIWSKNIASKPNIILMHGDLDQVVTIESYLEAKEFFNKKNYHIESKIFKNCEHRIPTEGSSLGLQFIKKHFKL